MGRGRDEALERFKPVPVCSVNSRLSPDRHLTRLKVMVGGGDGAGERQLSVLV